MALAIDTNRTDATLCPNAFGHFLNGGKEFLITNLATPMPWTNVMSNGRYGLIVSQNGGGFSWGDNCQTARITRWEQDLVEDRHGRFVYIQDVEEPHKLWSTTRQPTAVEADEDSALYGLGYATFHRIVDEIESSHTFFVPQDVSCEVWTVKLTNKSPVSRHLRIATYLEWHLGSAADWHHEFHRLFYETGTGEGFAFARKLPGLVPGLREREARAPIAYHSASGLESFEWTSDKGSFLGRPADLSLPGRLFGHKPQPANQRWNDPVASAMGEFRLEPGEEKTFVFTIGTIVDLSEAAALISRFTPQTGDGELEKVKKDWTSFCERSLLETEDPAIDLMANYWLKYQAYCGRMLARCAYYQQGGAYGFRDQLQDSLALLTLDSGLTKRQIFLHAEATYEDGAVRHWWHPNTKIFAESKHSDTCLWTPYATLAYLDETNDLSVLEVPLRYLSHETQQFGCGQRTLLDHCLRGVGRTLENLSPRGLPLIFSGDWNDGLSHAGIEGRGESVWLGMFLYDILCRWKPILQELGLGKQASELALAADSVAKAVNEFGWDGEWYLQGTRDDGNPLGSANCSEGQIFLNPQSWAIISGIAPSERGLSALQSAVDRLVQPYGALLLAPAFQKVDPFVGYITRYAPGLRENGGVYSHASTWMIQALAMAGRQDEARSLFKAMLPCNGRDFEHYQAEPYAMPGNVDGPDSPFEGRAGWTWYTGSAAWMYRMALDWVYGVRACRDGLLVNPRSGSRPLNFRLKRPFRGDVFRIEVSGCGPVGEISCETAEIVDGKLQPTGAGREHCVRVALG